MKLFHCDRCRQPIFFENVVCLCCKSALGFFSDRLAMGVLEADPRNCANREQDVCNWQIVDDAHATLCESCRLTRVIPDLAVAWHKEAWYRLEVAKRRLLYSLKRLGLPIGELAFEFLADQPEAKVFTGHSDGVITVNVAEADDVERERRRVDLHEPYRTLVGHFRHESGHYYWNVLIENGPHQDEFRRLFGDEQASYADAVKRHYENGAPADWQTRFISGYATMHPWEDWAETWAHYLHMTDALETARASGVSIEMPDPDHPSLDARVRPRSFDALLRDWHALTFVLNNLNRGLGLADAYPFVLSEPVVEKLRFVDTLVAGVPR